MSMKDLWQMSIQELDKEITTTKAIQTAGGYNKLVEDRLALLESAREERLIEESIVEKSSYAQMVLGLNKPTDKP